MKTEKQTFKENEKQASYNITLLFNPQGTEEAKREKRNKEILKSIFQE